MRFLGLYTFLGWWITAIGAWASLADDSWSMSLYFENDLFASTDQNYTNGTKLSLVSPDIKRFSQKAPEWAHDWIALLPFVNSTGDDVQKNLGISLGQEMYTPGDIASSALIRDDRPYAGWFYLGFAFHSKTEKKLDTVEIQVGVVGPLSLAETAQKFVHETRNLQRPNGWHHQLDDEPGLNLVYERKQRLYTGGISSFIDFDVIGHGGVTLGNVNTYANLGMQCRLGWNLPADFGVATIRPTGNIMSAQMKRKDSNFSFYTFAGCEGRLVLRDIFLDGNTFEDSHDVDRKPFVGDFSLGTSIRYHDFQVSYAQVFRTKQFEGQEDEHTFGSLTATYFF